MAGEIAGEMVETTCRGGQSYGFTEDFNALALEGFAPFTAPQVAKLADDRWLIAYLGAAEEGSSDINYIRVMTFDAAFEPVGEAQLIGRAKGGQFKLHGTSAGAMILWVNQRSELQTNEGVFVQSLDENGATSGETIAVSGSFNVRSIDSAWEDGFGGVLVLSEPQKLSAVIFNQTGLGADTTVLVEGENRSPSAAFTGGG